MLNRHLLPRLVVSKSAKQWNLACSYAGFLRMLQPQGHFGICRRPERAVVSNESNLKDWKRLGVLNLTDFPPIVSILDFLPILYLRP